jgi:UDP-N-acetylmuramoyl-tripeptide--D-alanyl-D-alanine ligase
MGELGTEAEPGHRRVGKAAAEFGIDRLITVGDDAAWIADEAAANGLSEVLKCGSTEEAAEALRSFAAEGDLVLVKGSRSARMERVVEGLQSS